MSLRVVLRPEAQADLFETRDWYERQQVGLGKAFSESVEEALTRIEALPQMYATVFHEVRRGKLRRFPTWFTIGFYRIEAKSSGSLHSGRDPKLWQERVN